MDLVGCLLVWCINKTECRSTFSIVPIRQELPSVFALDFQVLDVQFGNFLRRKFDHIVTVQEDWHLLPPHWSGKILARVLINPLFCKRSSIDVGFAPKATEVLHCRELTGCARHGHSGRPLITSLGRGTRHAKCAQAMAFRPRVHDRLKQISRERWLAPLPTGVLVTAFSVGGHLWDLRNRYPTAQCC